MRKLFIILAAFVALAATALIATPAQAGTYYEKHCHSRQLNDYVPTVKTCLGVVYHTQTDGTGVTVDTIYYDINSGCNWLLNDPIGDDSYVRTKTDIMTYTQYVGSWDSCTNSKSTTLKGPDVGKSVVTADITVRTPIGTYEDNYSFGICNGGTC